MEQTIKLRLSGLLGGRGSEKYLPAPEVKRGGNEEIRSPFDKPSFWKGLGRAIKSWLKADKRSDTNVFSEAMLRRQTETPTPAAVKKSFLRKKPRRIAQWGDRYIFDDPYLCPKCDRVSLRFTAGIRFD